MTAVAVKQSRLRVSEVFGPTFQGEGPSVGQRCSFLRLGGCNLHCTWCDTAYTWDWTGRNGKTVDPHEELRWSSPDDLWADISARGADMLVVSGGEPLMQQGGGLQALLTNAKRAGCRVEIETAGTVAPADDLIPLVDAFNVSPKLAHSGNTATARYRPEAIDALNDSGKAVWKFVVRSVEDLDEIAALVDRHALRSVWVMPEGTQAAEITARSVDLADAVLQRGWNMTVRLHILLYGERRGV